MNVGTWNTQGFGKKAQEVIHELQEMDMDITVMSKTKKKASGTEEIGPYIHIWSGVPKDQRGSKGVSIVIKKKYKKDLRNWEAIDERIIKVNLENFRFKLTILGIYAPNENEKTSILEEFYSKLDEIISDCGDKRDILLLGDFNARVGKASGSKVIGQFGEDVCNSNGKRLVFLCEQHNMIIRNGFFQHRDEHKYTWTDQQRGRRSVIDYVITPQNFQGRVLDVRAHRGPECGSNHYLVKSKIIFPPRKYRKENPKDLGKKENEQEIKYNLEGLAHSSTRYLYQNRLDNLLNENTEQTNTDMYEHLKKCLHQAAKEALGGSGREKRQKD